jgi:hypothetical protein
LSFANLTNAHLDGADLYGADLRCVKGLDGYASVIRDSGHWRESFYDDQTLRALELPPDHNQTLMKTLKMGHSENVVYGSSCH